METISLAVNTTVDENDGGEGGEGLSLRDAIALANQSPENNSLYSGGEITVRGAEANVYSSTISDNASGISGGGIDIQGGDSEPVVRIVNSTL